MALGVIANVGQHGLAGPPVFYDVFKIFGDGVYATNGNTGLLAKLQGLRKDARAIVAAWGYANVAGTIRTCFYDVANDKLLVFLANGSEAAAAADLSAVEFTIVALCK
jgi:hypothetical protein